MAFRVKLALFCFTVILAQSANAAETVSYTYDARGRLVQVVRSGTPNNGVSSTYTYDKADNRTNVTVTGSSNGNGSGGGATAPTGLFIVVPLNGYTLIKVS